DALVVRRAAEDRAGAVVHDDEVGDIDRKVPTRIEGMERLHPGVETLLLGRVYQFLRSAMAFAFGNECSERRILGCSGGSERMVGRERHELGAEQRVMPRGEDVEFVFPVRRG